MASRLGRSLNPSKAKAQLSGFVSPQRPEVGKQGRSRRRIPCPNCRSRQAKRIEQPSRQQSIVHPFDKLFLQHPRHSERRVLHRGRGIPVFSIAARQPKSARGRHRIPTLPLGRFVSHDNLQNRSRILMAAVAFCLGPCMTLAVILSICMFCSGPATAGVPAWAQADQDPSQAKPADSSVPDPQSTTAPQAKPPAPANNPTSDSSSAPKKVPAVAKHKPQSKAKNAAPCKARGQRQDVTQEQPVLSRDNGQFRLRNRIGLSGTPSVSPSESGCSQWRNG